MKHSKTLPEVEEKYRIVKATKYFKWDGFTIPYTAWTVQEKFRGWFRSKWYVIAIHETELDCWKRLARILKVYQNQYQQTSNI